MMKYKAANRNIPWAFILSVIFTAFWVHQVVCFGRYAYPVGVDDISYMVDGASRLDSWNKGVALWKQHAGQPPHSPIYTYVAMAAFSLIGHLDWAPLALCGLFIFFACSRIMAMFPQKQLVWGVVATLFFLSVPFSRYIITDFRPDMVTGLALGYGGFLIINSDWMELPWREWLLGGSIFGFALLLKPAYFPATLALFGAAMGCSILGGGLREFFHAPGKAVKLAAIALGGLLLLSLPHYIWAWRPVYYYVYDNMLGIHKDMWYLRMPLREQVLYYLSGVGGRTMLYFAWIPIFCCIFLCGALICIRSDKKNLRKFYGYCLYTVVAYIGVSATTYMTPYLGAAFFGAILVGTFAAVGYVMRFGSRSVRLCLGTIMVAHVLFAVNAKPFNNYHYSHREDALVFKRSVSNIVDDLYAYSHAELDSVITTVEHGFTGPTFRYEMLRKYGHAAYMHDLHREPSLENALRTIEHAGIVLTVENPQVVYLPNFTWLNTMTAHLNDDPRFTLVGRYPLGIGSMAALLYVDNSVSGFNALPMQANGFGPLEGPYPQWQLPRVRWAREEQPFLRIPPSRISRKLILEMRPAGANMEIDFSSGENITRRILLPDPTRFVREEFLIHPSEKEVLIRMVISEPPDEALPHRVLFKSLLLVPEPLRSISQLQ